MKALLSSVVVALACFFASETTFARTSRVVKFYGVPPALQPQLKRKFPFVFEREATLAEIDEIVRFLMKSGNFSNVEAVDRPRDNGDGRETAILVSLLRRIQDIHITGRSSIPNDDVAKFSASKKARSSSASTC